MTGKGDENATRTSSQSKRVYVGNLAWSVQSEDLVEFFEQTHHLPVTNVRVLQGPDGRSKGCAIAEFETIESAQQACLTLNDLEFHGRQIFIREDREKRSTVVPASDSQSRRVYVGNLGWNVSWQALKDHMRGADADGEEGEELQVVFAQIIADTKSGRSKGCGIVEYATEEQAQIAIERFTHSELQGRAIFVREDRENSNETYIPGKGADVSSRNTSVYVWNLTYGTSWQDLKDHMRRAGNVNSVTLLENSENGSSAGCGIVVYQKPAEAARAIRELNKSELNGRPIQIRPDYKGGHPGGNSNAGRFGGRGGRGRAGGGRGFSGLENPRAGDVSSGKQVFVANLSYDTTRQDLENHFKQCGQIESANTTARKGFGMVRFTSSEEAQAAIEHLHGVELQGRPLEVRLDKKA